MTQQAENSRFLSSRSAFQRQKAYPYNPGASQLSNFTFGSRNIAQQAPLFHSATEDFHEEDEEAEHERELADFYALQRSRRHFGGSHMNDSETVEDGGSSLHARTRSDSQEPEAWPGKGGKRAQHIPAFDKGRRWFADPVVEAADGEEDLLHDSSGGGTKGKLVDIRLEDTLRSGFHSNNSGKPAAGDDKPPSVQRFRELPRMNNLEASSMSSSHEENEQPLLEEFERPNNNTFYQALSNTENVESQAHDVFWAHLFLIALACLFATSFLIYLHTSPPPDNKTKWGDTIYLTIHGSFHRLGAYTLVSVLISILWLALLRSYLRPLVYAIIFAVPIILFSFFLYPFISSFRGVSSVQAKVMRWGSFVPFFMTLAWVYNVVRGRHAIRKAVSILEFACRILAVNAELLLLGLSNLALIVSWTWLWLLMFTRVFLGGHISQSKSFIINVSSWWLGVFFVLVYLWSLGVVAGVQRAVTAATVSQWYFHRLANPAPTSRQVVHAATLHSLTTQFGTICLSKLIALLIRMPFLVLPRRIASILGLFAYAFVSAPVSALTDPLALTFAAIHSRPLGLSALGLTQMTNLVPSIANSSFHPRIFSWSGEIHSALPPYKVSKLILHAARLMMSLALGFGGWVSTARNLGVLTDDGLKRGSIYAYVVGLVAGAIGWSVLGAIEGVVADIVDASIICWSSEVGTYGREARYCREAGWLFGQESHPESCYAEQF